MKKRKVTIEFTQKEIETHAGALFEYAEKAGFSTIKFYNLLILIQSFLEEQMQVKGKDWQELHNKKGMN